MAAEDSNSGFSWFFAGLGLGALLGVLYAPKPGRETREELLAKANDGSEYIKAQSRVAADKVSEFVDKGKGQVGEYVDRGKDYVDKGRAQWEEFVDKGKGFVDEQTDKVSSAVDAGKQAYRSTTSTTSTNDPTRF